MKAINEYSRSLINYYVGILDMEPDKFGKIDEDICQILIKHHVHQQPERKERLYTERNELGRGLNNIEFTSERMLSQFYNAIDSTSEICLRRKAILRTETENNTHLPERKIWTD